MTFFIAFTVLLLASATLLVAAGREFLRVNGFPQHPVQDVSDLVHLAALGYSALNDASSRAARNRMNGRQ
jgi:hypothetical protein